MRAPATAIMQALIGPQVASFLESVGELPVKEHGLSIEKSRNKNPARSEKHNALKV